MKILIPIFFALAVSYALYHARHEIGSPHAHTIAPSVEAEAHSIKPDDLASSLAAVDFPLRSPGTQAGDDVRSSAVSPVVRPTDPGSAELSDDSCAVDGDALEVELLCAWDTVPDTLKLEVHRGTKGAGSLVATAVIHHGRGHVIVPKGIRGTLIVHVETDRAYGMSRVEWPSEAKHTEVRLLAFGAVHGRVLGEIGADVGTTVDWRLLGADVEAASTVDVDSNGAFAIDRLIAGRYELFIARAQEVGTTFELAEGEVLTGVSIELPASPGSIHGVVLDEAGEPVPRARVVAFPLDRVRDAMAAIYGNADASGSFSIEPRDAAVHAVMATRGTGWGIAHSLHQVRALPGGVAVKVVLSDRGSETVTGTLPTLQSSVHVAIEHAAGATSSMASGGRFEIEGVVAGPATLRIGGPHVVSIERHFEVLPGGGADLGFIDLEPKGSIEVIVGTMDGKRLRGVGLYEFPGVGPPPAVTIAHRPIRSTDESGAATLRVVGGEPVRIVAWAEGWTAKDRLVRPSDRGGVFEFSLERSVMLELAGLRTITAPFLGWRATVRQGDEVRVSRSFNNRLERLEIPGLPPGSYVVELMPYDRDGAEVDRRYEIEVTLGDSEHVVLRADLLSSPVDVSSAGAPPGSVRK